jgi:DNA-binding XRE family transcriptional regulator
MKPHREPVSSYTRTLSGVSYGASYRAGKFAAARRLRTRLVPFMTQRQVGERLRVSRQAIEQIELKALSKLLAAFQVEREELVDPA